MATRIISGEAVHRSFVNSLRPLMRLIGLSLGPNDRSVLLASGHGVRCAASALDIVRHYPDSLAPQRLPIRILKEAMVASQRDHGDGSARLALIAGASFTAAVRMLGISSRKFGIDAFAQTRVRISELLEAERCDMTAIEDIARAAGANEQLAEVLSTLFREVGAEGVIEVFASRAPGIDTAISRGFIMDAVPLPVDSGCTDESLLTDVHVIAAREVISDFGVLSPVIEGFASCKKSLLIVARDITGSALAALERNRTAGVLSVLALKPRDAGPRGDSVIGDLAVATGATLIAADEGTDLRTLKPAGLGRAASLQFAGGRLFLAEPRGSEREIAVRCAQLESEIAHSRYLSLDREHAERRRARLQGRWAEVRIGGGNAFETDALVAVAKSAVASMRSADRHGVIWGAGWALSRVATRLERDGKGGPRGLATLAAAHGLRSIERQLLANSGSMNSPSGLSTRAEMKQRDAGFPVQDPLRLTQAVVDQALSLASTMLSIEAAVHR